MNKIINGKEVSNFLKEQLKSELSLIEKRLQLVVIQVGDDEASNVYINNKKKLCEEMKILFNHLKYDHVEESDLLGKIDELNNDPAVTGILVQLPLPNYLNKNKIIERINYKKDVDGLTSVNLRKLYNKEIAIIPCTALGIMKLFDYYKIDLDGKKVTIVGRSSLVGLPLFKLLLDKNCTITMCHSKTRNLKEYTVNSDIVIMATGKKDLLTKEMVRPNSILIDVGINRINGKIYGDIEEECLDNCSMITPVPGGVGPMTVIMLINNIIECYKLQK